MSSAGPLPFCSGTCSLTLKSGSGEILANAEVDEWTVEASGGALVTTGVAKLTGDVDVFLMAFFTATS